MPAWRMFGATGYKKSYWKKEKYIVFNYFKSLVKKRYKGKVLMRGVFLPLRIPKPLIESLYFKALRVKFGEGFGVRVGCERFRNEVTKTKVNDG